MILLLFKYIFIAYSHVSLLGFFIKRYTIITISGTPLYFILYIKIRFNLSAKTTRSSFLILGF
jgi:hypothetical protein